MEKMQAVVCEKYGPPEVLKLTEVPKPAPGDNEVLVKNIAATVHIGDSKIRRLEPGMGRAADFIFKLFMRISMGFSGPRKKILGMELSGVVEEIGKNITRFKVGDKVFASTEFKLGAYAQYCCVAEDDPIAFKPENLSFEEAAPLSNGALTALIFLRKAKIEKGKKVLIYGASGSVGTYAVQLAKYFGTEVTGVCSKGNMNMVKSIGADSVLDYKLEDFTHSGRKYDIIFDAVGKIPASKRKISLNPSGVYYNVLSLASNFKLKIEDLNFLKDLCESGRLKPVIDKIYPLSHIVEAHRYVDLGHKKGNVVIKIDHND